MILDTIEEGGFENIKQLGDKMAKKAFDLSLLPDYISPFSINANISLAKIYIGGKSDDITISLGVTKLKID